MQWGMGMSIARRYEHRKHQTKRSRWLSDKTVMQMLQALHLLFTLPGYTRNTTAAPNRWPWALPSELLAIAWYSGAFSFADC